MANAYFRFKQFIVHHEHCAMKVTTDACLFGAWCAAEMKKQEAAIKTVLDIGAGTGLLSLMVIQKNTITIDAVEIEEQCAAQARDNVQASSWADQLQIVQADIRQYQPSHQYDCIISNPPFYEKEIKSPQSHKNTAHHSEQLALNELLPIITTLLKEEGIFFLLLPYKRRREAEQLLSQHHLAALKSIIVRPSLRHPPSRLMLMGTKGEIQRTQVNELSIRNPSGEYTEPFIALLTDYYLHL